MNRLRSKLLSMFKLVCLSKPVNVTDNRKDTSLRRNVSISRNLWIRNVLNYTRKIILYAIGPSKKVTEVTYSYTVRLPLV